MWIKCYFEMKDIPSHVIQRIDDQDGVEYGVECGDIIVPPKQIG